MVEILMFEAFAEVRELFMRSREGPVLPDGVLKGSHMDLVPDVEREVLEPIENSPEPCCLPWTNSGECRWQRHTVGIWDLWMWEPPQLTPHGPQGGCKLLGLPIVLLQ